MEHCIGLLLEPLIGLLTVCTEVVAICFDGCLQTCRESFRCIGCNCGICKSHYDDHGDDQESQPILQRTQPATSGGTMDPQEARAQRWSSVGALRGVEGRD